jgi:hypothetical protein
VAERVLGDISSGAASSTTNAVGWFRAVKREREPPPERLVNRGSARTIRRDSSNAGATRRAPMRRELFAREMVAGLLRWPRCRNFCGDIDSRTNDLEAFDPETAGGIIRACDTALVDTERPLRPARPRGSPADHARISARPRRAGPSWNSRSQCPRGEAVIVRVQVGDPQETHAVLRFIERMGFAARTLADEEIEVDAPNDVSEHAAWLELDLYLSLWRVTNERYDVELLR